MSSKIYFFGKEFGTYWFFNKRFCFCRWASKHSHKIQYKWWRFGISFVRLEGAPYDKSPASYPGYRVLIYYKKGYWHFDYYHKRTI